MESTALLPLLGYASGWALLGLFLLTFYRMLASGRLVTAREANWMREELGHKDQLLALKDETIREFTQVSDTSNGLIRAVLEVAQEKGTP